MTTVIRRSMALIIFSLLLSLGMVLSASRAHAQCASITVTNNLPCDLELCLYSTNVVVPLCFNIPANSVTVINLPATFNVAGVVSAGGNRYGFPAVTGGCTRCFIQRSACVCCGEVCFDRANCTISINNTCCLP